MSIPREFSKTKEEINQKAEIGETVSQGKLNHKPRTFLQILLCQPPQIVEEEDKGDDTEVLLKAIQCKKPNPNYASGTVPLKHTVDMEQLVKYEFEQEMDLETYKQKGLDPNSKVVKDGVGGNVLDPPPQRWWVWVFICDHQCGLFSQLLWTAGVLCFIAFGIQCQQVGYDGAAKDNMYLGIVLVFVVFVTGVFSYSQEAASNATMDKFKDMLPQQVTVIRGGLESEINASDLVVGDVVTIEMGAKIPADVRMFECINLKVEQSSLTGEPDAIGKNENKTHENPLESANVSFFGTAATEGTGKGFVISVGMETTMGCIAQMASEDKGLHSPIELEIHRFIMIVSSVAIFLGISFFVVSMIIESQTSKDYISPVVFGIGIIVANVPEGLLATLTIALTLTAQRLAAQDVQMKNLEAVETLGSTTCICSDKTGTLTQNKMTAKHIYLELEDPKQEDHVYDVLGLTAVNTYDTVPATNLQDQAYLRLMWCCNLVNKSVFTKGKDSQNQPNMAQYIQARQLVGGNASDFAFTKFAEGWAWRKESPEQIDYKASAELKPKCEVMRDECPVAKGPVGGGKFQPLIIPFNSAWKFMVSINEVVDYKGEKRFAVFMKGAAERVFQRCGRYVKGADFVPIDNAKAAHFIKTYNNFGKQGERLIGFAMKFLDEVPGYAYDAAKDEHSINGTPFDLSGNPDDCNYAIGTEQYEMIEKMYDGSVMNVKMDGPAYPAAHKFAMDFVGIISLIDPPRETVPKSVIECRNAGVKVVMVTGDHPLTAAAIARMVNIIQATAETADSYAEKYGCSKEEAIERNKIVKGTDRYKEIMERDDLRHLRGTLNEIEAKVVPGHELVKLSEREVQMAFMYRDLVFARTSPEQKLKIVNAAQNMGHIVAVTGDGVNDSPALNGANIGCAMGIAGTDVSKDAADMILMNDDFSAIVTGVREGRLIFDNLKKSIAYTLSSNIPEISPFLMNVCAGIPLSLSTVLILCVDLGTDMIPAISLAYEQAEADIMERPPRDAKEDHLVTFKLVSFAYLQIGVFQALGGFYSFFTVMYDYGFRSGDIFGDYGKSYNAFPVKTGNILDSCPCGGGGWSPDSLNDMYKYNARITGGSISVDGDGNVADKKLDAYITASKGKNGITTSNLQSELCPSAGLGLGFETDANEDEALGDYKAANWPYTFGCQYGSLKPQRKCKYPDLKHLGAAKNPCYKATIAIQHGQTAAFISIVIVQWADLVICKTRSLSMYHQGMRNSFMVFGLFSETLLCAILAYTPGIDVALGTQPVQFIHWIPSMPFSIMIFLYDETRKYIMRNNPDKLKLPFDKYLTGILTNGKKATGWGPWLRKFTYY